MKKKEKYTPHTTPFAAFLKQENVNMVIFSTCFKTDHFSEREKDSKRGRHKREAEKEKKKYEKKKKQKKLAHTRYKASPDLCVCSSLRNADRLWLPLFAHSSTKSSALVPTALTCCRTPNWIHPTVSLQSQQQLNNTKTLHLYRPSVRRSNFSC